MRVFVRIHSKHRIGLIGCVQGLGPNLFYNSPTEACIVMCRSAMWKERRKKILFRQLVGFDHA